MHVELTKADIARFVADQVKAGRFSIPEAVVESALTQMMEHEHDIQITNEDVDAIARAETQIDQGQCVDLSTFASQMRQKYVGK